MFMLLSFLSGLAQRPWKPGLPADHRRDNVLVLPYGSLPGRSMDLHRREMIWFRGQLLNPVESGYRL